MKNIYNPTLRVWGAGKRFVKQIIRVNNEKTACSQSGCRGLEPPILFGWLNLVASNRHCIRAGAEAP